MEYGKEQQCKKKLECAGKRNAGLSPEIIALSWFAPGYPDTV